MSILESYEGKEIDLNSNIPIVSKIININKTMKLSVSIEDEKIGIIKDENKIYLIDYYFNFRRREAQINLILDIDNISQLHYKTESLYFFNIKTEEVNHLYKRGKLYPIYIGLKHYLNNKEKEVF